jgi:hypothetical protein
MCVFDAEILNALLRLFVPIFQFLSNGTKKTAAPECEQHVVILPSPAARECMHEERKMHPKKNLALAQPCAHNHGAAMGIPHAQ